MLTKDQNGILKKIIKWVKERSKKLETGTQQAVIIKQVYEVDGMNWSGDNRNRDDRRAVTNMTQETALDDSLYSEAKGKGGNNVKFQ